jgi:hypothetical protein
MPSLGDWNIPAHGSAGFEYIKGLVAARLSGLLWCVRLNPRLDLTFLIPNKLLFHISVSHLGCIALIF